MKGKILLGILVATVVFTSGCGDREAGKAETTQLEEQVSEIAQAVESASEESDNKVADEIQEEEDSSVELVDRVNGEDIKTVLDEILTWAGTKYFYDPVTEYEGLDDTTKIDMAAFACEMNSNEDEGMPEHTDDWRLIVSDDKMDAKMKALFGVGYDSTLYVPYKNTYVKIDDGTLSISQGDWGLVVPTAEYKAIYDDKSNDFVIEASYTAFDFMENAEIAEYDYEMVYECELTKESENGFIIKNITSMQKGSLPAKFDPAPIAGVYVSKWTDEIEGEVVENVNYLALWEDGTGTWAAQDFIPIAFDGYDIYVGSEDNPMPYSYYEDELTVYPDDEVYEHYVKTDMTREEFEAYVDSFF